MKYLPNIKKCFEKAAPHAATHLPSAAAHLPIHLAPAQLRGASPTKQSEGVHYMTRRNCIEVADFKRNILFGVYNFCAVVYVQLRLIDYHSR